MIRTSLGTALITVAIGFIGGCGPLGRIGDTDGALPDQDRDPGDDGTGAGPAADPSNEQGSGTGGGETSGSESASSGSGDDPATPPKQDTGPFDGAAVCTSNEYWTQGRRGSRLMFPGRACITCHATAPEEDAPDLYIGGTVFPTGHEPNDCNGTNSTDGATKATVVITDAQKKVINLNVNEVGNFLIRQPTGRIEFPITAKVVYGGKERAMGSAQMTGDCNSCHTDSGANGAPGRIVLP